MLQAKTCCNSSSFTVIYHYSDFSIPLLFGTGKRVLVSPTPLTLRRLRSSDTPGEPPTLRRCEACGYLPSHCKFVLWNSRKCPMGGLNFLQCLKIIVGHFLHPTPVDFSPHHCVGFLFLGLHPAPRRLRLGPSPPPSFLLLLLSRLISHNSHHTAQLIQ